MSIIWIIGIIAAYTLLVLGLLALCKAAKRADECAGVE